MKIKDFYVGVKFRCGADIYWQCTDTGTRTIAAIIIDKADTPVLLPPYSVPELVFSEEEIEKCSALGYDETEACAPENAICLRAAPEYELRFQAGITELVMRHIDRMNDVCEEDTAEDIINSFRNGFDALFEPYLNEKFPGRSEMMAQVAARPETGIALVRDSGSLPAKGPRRIRKAT